MTLQDLNDVLVKAQNDYPDWRWTGYLDGSGRPVISAFLRDADAEKAKYRTAPEIPQFTQLPLPLPQD